MAYWRELYREMCDWFGPLIFAVGVLCIALAFIEWRFI